MNHLSAVILNQIDVIFKHAGESVFIHLLKKVGSGRTASGQTSGKILTADSSIVPQNQNIVLLKIPQLYSSVHLER